MRCCPTVVARVVAEGLLAFRDLLILHHKYYPQYHSACHILSLLCSVLCLFAHVLILYAFNTHTLNTHRVMSRHSWRLSSNSQTVQMPLWSQLTALPLMTPLRGSILCSVCAAGLGVRCACMCVWLGASPKARGVYMAAALDVICHRCYSPSPTALLAMNSACSQAPKWHFVHSASSGHFTAALQVERVL